MTAGDITPQTHIRVGLIALVSAAVSVCFTLATTTWFASGKWNELVSKVDQLVADKDGTRRLEETKEKKFNELHDFILEQVLPRVTALEEQMKIVLPMVLSKRTDIESDGATERPMMLRVAKLNVIPDTTIDPTQQIIMLESLREKIAEVSAKVSYLNLLETSGKATKEDIAERLTKEIELENLKVYEIQLERRIGRNL